MTSGIDPNDFERSNRVLMEKITDPLRRRHETNLHSLAKRAHPSTRSEDSIALDPAVMIVVLEARAASERWFPHMATRGNYWTRLQVNRLISIGIPNWCSRHGLLWPESACEQVWLLLDMLHDTGILHFDSDTIEELREPLRCYGQLDENGRPGTAQSIQQCRCYWPTRRQLELGLEENPPPMPDSFDWYRDEQERAAS